MIEQPPTELAMWIISHARDDVERGRPVPPQLTEYIRRLLSPRGDLTANGHEPEQPAKMISAADYARLTGCSPRTIRRHCQRGRIPGARRIAGAWMIAIGGIGGETATDAASDAGRGEGGDPRRRACHR